VFTVSTLEVSHLGGSIRPIAVEFRMVVTIDITWETLLSLSEINFAFGDDILQVFWTPEVLSAFPSVLRDRLIRPFGEILRPSF
jgi:hypothetical protein